MKAVTRTTLIVMDRDAFKSFVLHESENDVVNIAHDKAEILRSVSVFSDVHFDILCILSRNIQVRTFQRNDVIVESISPANPMDAHDPSSIYIIMSGEVSVINRATLMNSFFAHEDQGTNGLSSNPHKRKQDKRLGRTQHRPKSVQFEVSRLGASEFFGRKELELQVLLPEEDSFESLGVDKSVSLFFMASSITSVLVLKPEHLKSLPLEVQDRFEICMREKAKLRKARIENKLFEARPGSSCKSIENVHHLRNLNKGPELDSSDFPSTCSRIEVPSPARNPQTLHISGSNMHIHLNDDSHSSDLAPLRIGTAPRNPWKLEDRFEMRLARSKGNKVSKLFLLPS